MKDVSIIVLTYNQWNLTRQTLESIQNVIGQGLLSLEVIVVDNGSVEPIIENIRRDFPWVLIVDNGVNLGFSAGNNRGVEIASGKYVLFLNSDTKIFPETLPFLLDRMEEDKKIGIATCKVVFGSGLIDPASHRGFPTPWRALAYYLGLEKIANWIEKVGGSNILTKKIKLLFCGYHLGYLDLEVPHEIDACRGAFLLIRSELGKELGWWDEQFFMYGEDLDLCYRVKDKGFRVMYFPQVKIVHFKHSSGLKVDIKKVSTEDEVRRMVETKKRTTKAFYDAMKLFYLKHYNNLYPAIIKLFVFGAVDLLKFRAIKRIR